MSRHLRVLKGGTSATLPERLENAFQRAARIGGTPFPRLDFPANSSW